MNKIRVPLCLLLALAACSSHYNHVRMSSGNAFAERRGSGPTWVAWYRSGEIVGAEAAGDPDFPLGDWLSSELVDHPNLAQWRRQLADLQVIAREPDTHVNDLTRAASGFPFRAAVAEACSSWVGGRADRAGELLDRANDVDFDDAFADRLATTALGSDPDDARVAAWVRTLTAEDHDEAVLTLVTSPGVGPRTAEAALTRLDEYSSRQRAAIFAGTAPRLLRDPTMADCIVEAADKLPSSAEGDALAELLAGDVPHELARQVLRHLDDVAYSQRARLFRLAAERCHRDARGQYAITRAMQELPGSQRLDAARVVELPDATEALVVMMVDGTETLPSRDREEFLTLVLDGRHGSAPAVREACADAARRHLPSRARERVLERLGYARR